MKTTIFITVLFLVNFNLAHSQTKIAEYEGRSENHDIQIVGSENILIGCESYDTNETSYVLNIEEAGEFIQLLQNIKIQYRESVEEAKNNNIVSLDKKLNLKVPIIMAQFYFNDEYHLSPAKPSVYFTVETRNDETKYIINIPYMLLQSTTDPSIKAMGCNISFDQVDQIDTLINGIKKALEKINEIS